MTKFDEYEKFQEEIFSIAKHALDLIQKEADETIFSKAEFTPAQICNVYFGIYSTQMMNVICNIARLTDLPVEEVYKSFCANLWITINSGFRDEDKKIN